MPKIVIKFVDVSEFGAILIIFGNKLHIKQLIPVEIETDPTLKIRVKRLNSAPLYWRYKQLANLSIVAMIIAVSPPKKRKVRKIIESEKLKMNLERGKVMLIRGAIKTAKRNKRENCHESASAFRFNKAKTRHKPPKKAIAIL
jgi:hypothetical protein